MQTGISPEIMLAPLAVCLLGALSAVVLPDIRRVTYCLAFVASLGIISIGLLGLGQTDFHAQLPATTPYTSLAFRLDALSAWFLLVIGAVSAASAIYAMGYVNPHHYGSPIVGAAFCLFVGTMAGVVLADGIFSFMLFWELMSASSFVLMVHDHHLPEVRRAGFIYLAMAHMGAACLLAGFLLLAGSAGGLGFSDLRVTASALSPFMRDGAFLLFLVGFAAKAGIIPLHIWLPGAHPAAPSHVSALMSGVMIKLAAYGLIRVTNEFLAPMPEWWGWSVLGLGAISAVMGALYALTEHDLKRILAYSSVENSGIILMGIGVSMILAAQSNAVAVIALTAALLHTVNHAMFKGLLFLGAGAVQKATGTRNLERLGGLIHVMPKVAALFLVGAAAGSAIPPLNGFASEWLTFQALLGLTTSASGPMQAIGAALSTGALALTASLASFCFIQAFGVAFLGVPRAHTDEPIHTATPSMLAGMGLLALPCILLGLFPSIATDVLKPMAANILLPTVQAPIPQAALITANYVPVVLTLVVIACASLALFVIRMTFGAGWERRVPPWVCGIVLEPRMQYTASALAKPVRIIFEGILRPYRVVERRHAQAPYFVTDVHYEGGMRPIYESYLYKPVQSAVLRISGQVRRLQSGSLRVYLSYIFVTLVVVLVLSR